MQSGSAEKAAPPSLQPHNKACNYCSFPPSSIYPSLQHSLPTSGPIPHSPDSLLPSPPSSLAMCLPPAMPLSPPLHLSHPLPCLALSPIHSSSTLSISASLSAHAPADFSSNEPPSVEAVETPFISTFFFPLYYFPIHHYMCACVFFSQATFQSIRP